MLNLEVLRPYSICRGGVTWALQQAASLELVLLRGRCSSSAAARGYLQEGLALPAQAALSREPRSHRVLHRVARIRRMDRIQQIRT